MDYTTISRQLIYKDREDIDEFPVDETDNTDFVTMESVFMEKLEARRFIKDSFNAPELILMIFNNARYITTLIHSENHPQHYLHKYLKIAENDSQDIIMCNHAMPATMALVVNYLLHYSGDSFFGSKIVKAIIENFNDWDTKGASEGKQDFFDLLINRTSETDKYPRWATDDGEFPRRDIKEVINDTDIDPHAIIGDLDYVIQETFGMYSGEPEYPLIMKAIKALMENFERTEQIHETTREMLDIAYQKLKKAYPHAGLKWKENASTPLQSGFDVCGLNVSLQSSKMLNPLLDSEMEQLQGQIDDLKEEVNQLAREKAALEKNIAENNAPEKAFTATGNECFTKAKMGLLIYTIASLTDGPTPIKNRLVPIISTIGGWEEKSVNSEMKKAGFNQKDIDAVAKVFESVMPKFAIEIRKQIPRRGKQKSSPLPETPPMIK